MERGIEAAEGGVIFLQKEGIIWIGSDAGRNFNDRVRSFVNRGELASTDGRKNRSSVGSAFFRFHQFDFVRVNIGLNLSP